MQVDIILKSVQRSIVLSPCFLSQIHSLWQNSLKFYGRYARGVYTMGNIMICVIKSLILFITTCGIFLATFVPWTQYAIDSKMDKNIYGIISIMIMLIFIYGGSYLQRKFLPQIGLMFDFLLSKTFPDLFGAFFFFTSSLLSIHLSHLSIL